MTDETVSTLDRLDNDMLLSRLSMDVWESFTAEQRAALWEASHTPTWRRYPVNMRIAVTLFGIRYFLTVVGGVDRRNMERLRRERRMNPLTTFGNLVFLIAAAAIFYIGALVLLFLISALVEF